MFHKNTIKEKDKYKFFYPFKRPASSEGSNQAWKLKRAQKSIMVYRPPLPEICQNLAYLVQ